MAELAHVDDEKRRVKPGDEMSVLRGTTRNKASGTNIRHDLCLSLRTLTAHIVDDILMLSIYYYSVVILYTTADKTLLS